MSLVKPLQLIAHFTIHPGKTDEFKKIVSQCIEVVEAKEAGAGTLQYDWHFNADQSECKVIEAYRNSEAVLEHAANIGPYLGQFFEISTFSGEVFGPASESLKKALEGMDIKYYEFESGL
ncbi:putative quinol monooxygenase [Robiginitalea sp.]|uniref:putative quinol monooxygenase n=1 Tax=Robiginitalea sp. TaxID=1902411 RepID=UPI003C35C880